MYACYNQRQRHIQGEITSECATLKQMCRSISFRLLSDCNYNFIAIPGYLDWYQCRGEEDCPNLGLLVLRILFDFLKLNIAIAKIRDRPWVQSGLGMPITYKMREALGGMCPGKPLYNIVNYEFGRVRSERWIGIESAREGGNLPPRNK